MSNINEYFNDMDERNWELGHKLFYVICTDSLTHKSMKELSNQQINPIKKGYS